MENSSEPQPSFRAHGHVQTVSIDLPATIGLFKQAPPPASPPTAARPGQAQTLLRPGTPVKTFSATCLALIPGIDAFLSHAMAPLSSDSEADVRVIHSGESIVRAMPHGYASDLSIFGCGRSTGADIFALNSARMRQVETISLRDTIFSPQSATVMQPSRGFYDQSLLNFGDGNIAFDRIAGIDPLYRRDQAHGLTLAAHARDILRHDVVAMPVCGTGFHNYGHFLFDGLPMAFLLHAIEPRFAPVLVGPELAPWQCQILQALGLADRYRALPKPALFDRLIVPNLIAHHVSYPVRVLRPMMDLLRFRLASNLVRDRRIFVSRRHDRSRRVMRNRAEIENLFASLGFDIVVPETMSFADQVRIFAASKIVVGEAGAGMANVAFCDPGTRILEIQPETFFDGWTRGTCLIMALQWNAYFAKCHSSDDGALHFSVDIGMLRNAIEQICGP